MKIEVIEIKELDNGDAEVTLDMDTEAQRLLLEVGFRKILSDVIKGEK